MPKSAPKSMSPEASARLKAVAELFRDKECFPEAVGRARKLFEGLGAPDLTRATDNDAAKLPRT